MKFIKLSLIAITMIGCSGGPLPPAVPSYSDVERRECLAKPELKADAALLLCAREHSSVFCPLHETQEIEETQIQETLECLDQY